MLRSEPMAHRRRTGQRAFPACARGIADRADGVVWRYAVADQPERHWKPVNDCDLHCDIGLLAEGLGGIDPCWPSPHNRNDER